MLLLNRFVGQLLETSFRYGTAIQTAAEWWLAARTLLPEIVTFVLPAKEWEEMIADPIYREFESFEDFVGRYGPAGEFHDWHHVVEQESGFSDRELNNTENIVRIPRGRHWLVTSLMMRRRECLGGLSYRQWLKGKSFEEHRRVGLLGLREAEALK